MSRFQTLSASSAVLLSLALAPFTAAQDRRATGRVDVTNYVIDAEINPRTQTLAAVAQVDVTAVDGSISSASFELNNALNVSKVVDAAGRQIQASRSQQDFQIRLQFAESLAKGKSESLKFSYDGRLTGGEESPVFGIKFAAINENLAYLMYPARWFPIGGYTTDRFTAELHLTVPAGYKVIASGLELPAERAAGDKMTYRFRYGQRSFPGSIAVVQGEPQRVTSGGITTSFFFRAKKDMANAYGEEIAKVMTYFTSIYGLPLSASLTVIETEDGTPNGYSAPGILFFSPRAIGGRVSTKLIANQISRQWWGTLVSAATRNHIWLTNGLARYSEFLYLEHVNGPSALEAEVRDSYIEALTIDQPPLIQAARFEDYSPEFWASTAGKGAAVLNMLRYVMGDKAFGDLLHAVPEQFANKAINTDDFRKAAEKLHGKPLNWFFLQWIESTGAPEFKLDYTVYRTSNGFRVMGKIAQDLDTFRMPVDLKIETEGNPEQKQVEVVGTSSEFLIDTFGKPKKVTLDPDNRVLRYSNPVRVQVAIKKGDQFAEVSEFTEALKEYQKALDVNRRSSLAHFRVAEIFMLQNNYQSAANEFREALNGDLEPRWTEVWAHINLGKIFDITSQRERAVNEYNQAIRTKDNTQGAQEEAAKYLKTPYERPRQSN